MVAKIKAAVDARTDENFVIIARTDAIAVNGFEDAIARATSYVAAGADVIFIEAPTTMEQVAEVPRRISVPTLYNWCHGGKSPTPPVAELKSLGYRFILFTDVLYAVSKLLGDLYGELKSTGSYGRFTKDMLPFDEFNNLIGLDRVAALDDHYGAVSKA
jgi:methylisocitrate lyase